MGQGMSGAVDSVEAAVVEGVAVAWQVDGEQDLKGERAWQEASRQR